MSRGFWPLPECAHCVCYRGRILSAGKDYKREQNIEKRTPGPETWINWGLSTLLGPNWRPPPPKKKLPDASASHPLSPRCMCSVYTYINIQACAVYIYIYIYIYTYIYNIHMYNTLQYITDIYIYIQTCTNSRQRPPLQLRNDSLKGHGPSSCIFSFIFLYKIYDMSHMSMICPIPGTQSLAVGARKEWVNSGLLGLFFILKPHLNFLNRILGISAQPIHILSFSFSVLSCSVDGPLLFTALKHKLSLSLLPIAGETNLTLATLSACLHLSRQILIGKN